MPLSARFRTARAVSSAGEHRPYKPGVAGSIPAPPIRIDLAPALAIRRVARDGAHGLGTLGASGGASSRIAHRPHEALHRVSLDVEAGRTTVILGANGAGKTTLLNAIAGLVRPQPGGRILFEGRSIEAEPPHRKVAAGIALVPEGRRLFGQMTVVDNLRMDIRAVDVETSEIVAVLKKSDRTSELLSVVVALADEFGQQLNLVPPSNRPAMEPIPVPATIAFSRAVDFEDRGEVDRAIQEYERTLELHPSHRDAQLALQRLRGTQ